jgi:GTP-binding protein
METAGPPDPFPIRTAEFITSAPKPSVFPLPQRPEIAFVGRSNVGKSSLMNCLLGRKSLVKTSSTPGKTRALNFFLVNEEFFFVDMPGYGYAKVSKQLRHSWKGLIEGYLLKRPVLVLTVLLVDARHPPTGDDQAMVAWLLTHGIPTMIVQTKVDKIPKSRRERQRLEALRLLQVPEESLLPFSSVTRQGRPELLSVIAGVIEAAAPRDEGVG